MGYWEDRIIKSRTQLFNLNEKQVNKQLAKYYKQSMKSTQKDFEKVYNKIELRIAEGEQVTPADLYKLDSYWQLQSQLRIEAQKLGEKSVGAMGTTFEKEWLEVYQSMALDTDINFATLGGSAKQCVESIWCGDGLNYSQRVWKNTELLMNDLNDTMVKCVITGKPKDIMVQELQKRYMVSYHQANTLVRTELNHIANEAAKTRYKDAGVTKVEFWADYDERRCEECGSRHKKIYLIDEIIMPIHPNCRCTLLPVIED